MRRDKSDTLLIFLLKARRPEKYKDRVSTEHSGTVQHKGFEQWLDELNDHARGLMNEELSNRGLLVDHAREQNHHGNGAITSEVSGG